MLNNLKVSQKLLVGFGSIVLFLVFISGIAIYQSYTLSRITQKLYEHPYTVGHAIQETQYNVVAIRSTVKDIMGVKTAEEVAQRIKLVDEYEARTYEALEIVKARYLGDPQDVKDALELFTQWKLIRDKIFSQFNNNDRKPVIEMIVYGDGIAHFTKLQQAIDKILIFSKDKASIFYTSAQEQSALIRHWLIALSIALIIIGVILTQIISHSITAPLSVAVKAAEQLATGDLRLSLQIDTQDETGQLLNAMQTMTGNLRLMIAQLIQSSQHLTDIVTQLGKNGQELLNGSEQQTASVTITYDSVAQMSAATKQAAQSIEILSNNTAETSASVEEMSASIESIANSTAELNESVDITSRLIEQMVNTIEQIATNSRDINQFSQTMVGKAQEGSTAMHNTMLSMSNISGTMQGIVQVIEKLNNSHQQINNIINVISEIARQTNLLALNAAIEAARAGEHGRGFAVVADEVRKLATRSAAATQEIINLINVIRKDSEDAIVATSSGAEKVNDGVELTKQAGVILNDIVQSIHYNNKMVTEISLATTRQTHASEEIIKNVETIRAMTKEVDVAAKEQAIGTQQIMNSIGVMNSMTEEVANSATQQTINSEKILSVTEKVAVISSQNRSLSTQLVDITAELKHQANSLHTLSQKFKV